MQSSHLAAFAPLFASGGKHLFSRAAVHFLSEITRYPQLHQYVDSVIVIESNVYINQIVNLSM